MNSQEIRKEQLKGRILRAKSTGEDIHTWHYHIEINSKGVSEQSPQIIKDILEGK